MNKTMLIGVAIGIAFAYFVLPRAIPIVYGVLGKGE